MAANIDHLTNDGVWGTAANWQPVSGVPGIGHTAIIPDNSRLAANVTDAGGDANVDLGLLQIERGYVQSFGLSGAPIQTAAGFFGVYSSGPVYAECHSGGAAQNMDTVVAALANSKTPFELGSVTGNAGEVIKYKALRGHLTIKANINWAATSEVYIGQVNNAADVNLKIVSGGETLPLFRQESGTSDVKSVITLGYVSHGTCTVSEAHIVTLHIGFGGQVFWKDETADADNVSIHVYGGGFLDLLATGVYKEIDNLYLYPGSACRFSHKMIGFTGTDGLVDMRGEAL